MRATPRPQLIGLFAAAALALGGLIFAWVSGLGAGSSMQADSPLQSAQAIEMGPDTGDSLGEVDGIAPKGGSAEANSDASTGRLTPVGFAASDRIAAGPGFVEYRAVLLVSDGANGQPVTAAGVTDVLWQGEPLSPESGWRATDADDDGMIEVVCRLPEGAQGAESDPDMRSFDVRVAAAGYVGAAATGVLAELEVALDMGPSGEDQGALTGELARDTGLVREVTLYAAGALVLDVFDAPPSAEGSLVLWFAPSAKGRKPDVELTWPIGAAAAKAQGVALMPSVGGGTRLVFEELPPGPLSLALAVEGAPVALQQALQLKSGEQLKESLRVQAGEVANGIVRDLVTKTPVSGVTVIVSPLVEGLTQRIDRLPYPAQVTDDRGAFSIPGLPLGGLDVELHTRDGAKHPREVVILEGNIARRHELNVRGSASLSGKIEVTGGLALSAVKVLVTTGEAAAGVRAKAKGFSLREEFGFGVYAEVDPSTGRFTAPAVPSGRKLVVHALASGSAYAIAHVSALKLDEARDGIEISLEPRHKVSFRVESSSGEPVTAVSVNFRGTIEAGLPGGTKRTVSRWSPAEDLEIQSDGLFTALPAFSTPQKVRLRWEGRARADFEWPVGTLEEIPTFTLVPDPIALVEVRGNDGVAVAGARVRASMSKSVPSPRKSGKGTTSSAVTDEFGRARLPLPLGDDGAVPPLMDLRVTARGYTASSGLTVDGRDALPAPPKVVVMERAELVEPAVITGRLVRGNGEPLLSPKFDGLRGGAAHVEGHAFELRGIRPGRVRVVAHCDLFESQAFKRLNLQPGERYDVGEIVMRPATVLSVSVKDSKGRTVKDAQVQLARLSPKKAGRKDLPKRVKFPGQADARGAFTRRNVPRATWRLVVKHRGHVTHQASVRLTKAKQRVQVKLKAQP